MSVENCRLIDLPTFSDPRGKLVVVEGSDTLPFAIKRAYYLYDVPTGASRGGHAHKDLFQLIVALSGSFDVIIDDGTTKRALTLDDPRKGLFVCPMIWRDICNFSSGSVCLVLASMEYDEDDYYRSYDTFLEALKEAKN